MLLRQPALALALALRPNRPTPARLTAPREQQASPREHRFADASGRVSDQRLREEAGRHATHVAHHSVRERAAPDHAPTKGEARLVSLARPAQEGAAKKILKDASELALFLS